MGNKTFEMICKKLVADYFNKALINSEEKFKLCEDDVFIVWMCKTLQNNKALASTTVPDYMYYEITYNGDKREVYFDAYKKQDNIVYNLTDEELSQIVE